MSLKSTTSLHSMLNRITNSAHRGAAEARILTKLQEEEERVLEYNDYNLNDTQVDYLAQMGINSSPSGWKSHPHVIHKIIENFILFEHVRWLIKTDYTCAFMKGEKFAKLASKIPKFKGVLRNAVLSVKDTARYGSGEVHPFLEKVSAPTLFLHDSLHYETPYSIAKLFLDNKKLTTLIGTTVVPIETTYFGESLYPELYEIQYVGDKILYVPEGHHANSYEQPRSAHWLLTTRSITVSGVNGRRFTIAIKRIESIRAHHIFLFTIKQCPIQDTYVTYDSPKLATVPSIFPSFPLSRRIVPFDYLEKMIEYSKAVKTNSHSNLDCKNRFLLSQEKYPSVPQSTRFLVTQFSFAITEERRKFNLKSNLAENNMFVRALQTQFGPWINYGERKHLERFLSAIDIKRFHYTFLLQDLEVNQWEIPTKLSWPGFQFSYSEEGDKLIFAPCTDPKAQIKAVSEIIEEIETKEVDDLFPSEEKEVFEEANTQLPVNGATEKTPLYATAKATCNFKDGRRCGLQIYVDHGFDPADVQAAYASARQQTRRALPSTATVQTHPQYPNFLEPKPGKFRWLSGTEIMAIGAVLGASVNLHTPAYCLFNDERSSTDVNVYHENSNHWVSNAHNSTPCNCT